MENVATIDFKKPYSKFVEVKPARILKQKRFYTQNGVDYDINGNALNTKQVEQYYNDLAAQAQEQADQAKEAATKASAAAKEMAKAATAATKK